MSDGEEEREEDGEPMRSRPVDSATNASHSGHEFEKGLCTVYGRATGTRVPK